MFDIFRKKIPVLVFKDTGSLISVEKNKIVLTPSGYKIKIDGELRYVNPKIIKKRVYFENKPYAVLFYDKTKDFRGIDDISPKDIKKIQKDTEISLIPQLNIKDPIEKEWFIIEHEKKQKEWSLKKEFLEKIAAPIMFIIIIFSMIIVGYTISDLAGKLADGIKQMNAVTNSFKEAIEAQKEYAEVMNITLNKMDKILNEKTGTQPPI